MYMALRMSLLMGCCIALMYRLCLSLVSSIVSAKVLLFFDI